LHAIVVAKNCCYNEKIAELLNLLIYSWFWSLHGMTNKNVENYFDDFAKKNALCINELIVKTKEKIQRK
jgi:hypothetical protein